MTLADIEKIDKPFLLATDVADYIGTGAHSIRLAAQKGQLPWAYCVLSHVKIPKDRFIAYHKGKEVICT